MTTNESIERYAADLLRRNLWGASFEVAVEPSEDLERLAIRLQQLGCRVKRHPGSKSLTVDREGGAWA